MATVKRFAEPVSDEQEIVLRAGAIPTTTKNSTEWGIRVWNEWAQAREESNTPAGEQRSTVPVTTPLLQMPSADLSYWLGKFVMEVRKMYVSTHKNPCMFSCAASNGTTNSMAFTMSTPSLLPTPFLATFERHWMPR